MEEECNCDEGSPAWMATFSDLATLLLTFFVLLLSFAELDITEFKVMLGSIKDAFGVQTINPGPFHASSTSPIELMDLPTSLSMPLNDMEASLMRPLRRYIDENDMEESVELEVTDRGIVVRLRNQIVFESGSDRVKEEAHPILDHVRQIATEFPHGLSIEGHTDDRPIRTPRFPSNWELSTARATAVLRYMQRPEPLPVHNLKVVGFAATVPLGPNDTNENRARNRRVEFVFERPQQRPPPPGGDILQQAGVVAPDAQDGQEAVEAEESAGEESGAEEPTAPEMEPAEDSDG